MRQETYSLIGGLILVGLVACPSRAGIVLHASHSPEPEKIQVTSYLSNINEPLKKALLIHNLMNEMPGLRDTARTAEGIEKQSELMEEMQKNVASCSIKKLGKVFKNPENVWDKMTSLYEKKRQDSQKELEQKKQDRLTLSLKERQENDMTGWKISRDILMEVYTSPEKWGDVNKGEVFPLWKDQIALFENEWNQYYDKLNAAYGVPLKGRPSVDEETRHNAEKYNEVLAAHKAYVTQISEGRKLSNPDAVKGNPPKAPKGLPRWQDIVRVDPLTGKATPELPEPWKKMSDKKFKDYVDGGEMAQFFNGKSLTPTANAMANVKSSLEVDYDMTLATDALKKGVEGTANNQEKLVQPFIDKLKELGVDTKDFDIANRGQYIHIQKQLQTMKKKAMEEAYKYVELLEEQDQKNPDLVAKRAQLAAQKKARLSAKAKNAIGEMSEIVQISQMSPSAQQRLLLSALEKDTNALVHLTQTNAMNVDQLMREQKSTNKIIAESYKQVDFSLEKQREAMPQMAECYF